MKYFSTILILFLLVGCQKFQTIQVIKDGENLVFGNKMATSNCTESIFIYDFEITYTKNGITETAWMLIRNQHPNTEEKAFDFPLTYGKSPTGVNTTTKAMELKPGIYKLGATLSCRTNNDLKSISLIGSFAINQNGDLITEKSRISDMKNKI